MFRLVCGLGALSRMDNGYVGGEFEMNSRPSHEPGIGGETIGGLSQLVRDGYERVNKVRVRARD